MKRLRMLRRWFARTIGYARLFCIGFLIGLAALRIADPAGLEDIRLRTFDTFQLIDPRVKTARPVTIIDIDEKSLAKLGQWPWPRTRIADMIINLTRLGEQPQRFLLDFPGLLRNIHALEEAAAGRGLFSIKPERDGIVRRVPMLMQAQGTVLPSLSFEILRVVTSTRTILVKSEKSGL